MTRWFLSLPKYAKEFTSRPDGGKVPVAYAKMRALLRQNLSGSYLLFKKLPNIFSDDLAKATTQIIAAKKILQRGTRRLESLRPKRNEGNFLGIGKFDDGFRRLARFTRQGNF